MNEADYREHIELRVRAEFEGIENCRRRGPWCDGFICDLPLFCNIV